MSKKYIWEIYHWAMSEYFINEDGKPDIRDKYDADFIPVKSKAHGIKVLKQLAKDFPDRSATLKKWADNDAALGFNMGDDVQEHFHYCGDSGKFDSTIW